MASLSIAQKTAMAFQVIAERKTNGEPPAATPLVPALRILPCVDRGDRLPNLPCGATLYHCNRFNATCSPLKACDGAVHVCLNCDKYVAKKKHFLTHADLAEQAVTFARNIPSYPEGKFRGRGIVICGGGKYWPSTYVSVRMVRHHGCELPIQVWFLGDAERDDRYRDLLAPLGVECVDALAHPAASLTRGLTGFSDKMRMPAKHPPFEAKSFAVLHSPFEEVLYLDADNYPCADPTPLFTDSRYLKTGGIYWPDMAHTNNWTRWPQWNVKPFGPDCGLEVGQYVLHKQLAWKPLNLIRWYDDHGDTYYGWGARFDHGDKGPHRVAWAYFKREYTMFTTHAFWRVIAFIQPGPTGESMFIHRCRSKFTLGEAGFTSTPQNGINIRAGLPFEDEALAYLEELRKALT